MSKHLIPGQYTSDDLDRIVVERDRQRAQAVASWEANGWTVRDTDCPMCDSLMVTKGNFRWACTARDCELGVG